MFSTSRHCSYIFQVVLKTFDWGSSHDWSQMSVLTIPFCDPSPPGISCNIDHRSEGPFNSSWRAFDSCYSASLLNQRRIEGGGLGKWNRKNSSKSMDHIFSDQNWNFESRLLHGDLLHLVNRLHFPCVKERADASWSDSSDNVLRKVLIAIGYLLQLTKLFLDRHDRKKLFDCLLDIFPCFDVTKVVLLFVKIDVVRFELLYLLLRDYLSHIFN